MIRQLRLSAMALLLASCSTVVDGQIQDVTIETQGAQNTLCYMQNRDFSFRFYPPQTLKVSKSPDSYTIRCLAPGNREKTVVVEPKIADSAFYNVANLGTGVPVDHLSAAMYELPDKIVINFEGMNPEGYEQPAYNQFFDRNPQLKGVEEFRPGRAALMRDAESESPALQLRDRGEGVSPVVFGGQDPLAGVAGTETNQMPSVMSGPPPVPEGSKTMSTDALIRSMNPQVFGGTSSPAASGAPVSMDAK